MKKMTIISLTFLLAGIIFSCSSGNEINVQSLPALISEEYISDDTYEIVCRGFPKQGLEGVQREESAKRAALLNAYYFVQARFDATVKPDADGTVVRYDVQDEFVVIYYRVTKKNLKSRIK